MKRTLRAVTVLLTFVAVLGLQTAGAATPGQTWLWLVLAAVAATTGVVALARHHPDAVVRRSAAEPASSPVDAVRRVPLDRVRPRR